MQLVQPGASVITTAGGNGAADAGKVPSLNVYGGFEFGSTTVVNGGFNVVEVHGKTGFSLSCTTDTGVAADFSPLGAGGGAQCHLGTTGTFGFLVDGTQASASSFAFGAYTAGQVLSAADETTAESFAIFGDGRVYHRDRSAGFAVLIPEPVITGNRTNTWPDIGGTILVAPAVNSVSPTSPNRTIEVKIGATTYYIAAKTTND